MTELAKQPRSESIKHIMNRTSRNYEGRDTAAIVDTSGGI